jgi:7-cyano-7-deazaguanine synthase
MAEVTQSTQSSPTSAVVLLSGGLDSSTVLAWARSEGRRCFALSFDYGQRHRIELERAREIASALGAAEHVVATIDLRAFGGSALTDDIEVPKDRIDAHGHGGDAIPVTYVPARNTIFLSHALAYAEVRGATEIWLGINAIDYSGYPDCRPEYLEAFQRLADLATKAGVEGHGPTFVAPLVELSKVGIVRKAKELGVPIERTLSCYDPFPDGTPCGRCDSCILRSAAIAATAGR